MKLLYVDNFRGFSNTYLPIDEVNFLVGENSTGKTSILALLKLLSSPEFWLYQQFRFEDVNLGHYKDIVSVNSEDKSYFSIGVIEDTDPEGRTGYVNAVLMSFVERQGMPSLAMHAQAHGDSEFRLRITPGQRKYKRLDVTPHTDVKDFVHDVFHDWTCAVKEDRTGYKKIPSELEKFAGMPPAFLLSDLHQFLGESQSKTKSEMKFWPVIPSLARDISWLAPIRTKPRKTYDEYTLEFSSEGAHTPYLIKSILEKKKDGERFRKFIRKVGKDSGLFEGLKTKNYEKGATAPFELDVILKDYALSVSNVGYGVSQALPVIVECFASRKGSWLAVQQPEVHLHPKAQAAFGDMFYQLADTEGKRFVIETHSDYMLDRFRINYRKKRKKRKPQAQILYFERRKDGNRVFRIPIDENGQLPGDQPAGYRGFFIREDMKMLGL